MSQNDGEVSDDIDGFKYRVFMLDPLVAADMLADLGYLMAPVVGPLGGLLATSKGDMLASLMDADVEDSEDDDETSVSTKGLDVALEKAVKGFFDRFTKAKQREFMGILAKNTLVIQPDGNEPKLDKVFSPHFRGRIKSMYLWFFFAMKTQFKDFFSGQENAMSRAFDRVAQAAS